MPTAATPTRRLHRHQPNTTDVFVYTIKDGDGDLSTTTLTINLTDSALQASNDDEVTV